MEIKPLFVPAKVQLAFCIYKTAMMQQSALLLQGAKRMFNDIITSHPKHADAYSLFAQVIIMTFACIIPSPTVFWVFYTGCLKKKVIQP
jgi:hypothetical protein